MARRTGDRSMKLHDMEEMRYIESLRAVGIAAVELVAVILFVAVLLLWCGLLSAHADDDPFGTAYLGSPGNPFVGGGPTPTIQQPLMPRGYAPQPIVQPPVRCYTTGNALFGFYTQCR